MRTQPSSTGAIGEEVPTGVCEPTGGFSAILPIQVGVADAETTYSMHFTTPYLVLRSGECLMAYAFGSDVEIYVSGLLVTNLQFLPLSLNSR